MTLIKISEDGLMGKEVNPYQCDGVIDSCPDGNLCKGCKYSADFFHTHPPYPLTEPGEPNCEVEAELVWQYNANDGSGWLACDEKWYNKMVKHNDKYPGAVKTKKAWQVSKPKIETPPTAEVTEQSIEAAAEAYKKEGYKEPYNYELRAIKECKYHSFIAGANHILTSKGMVERDKVVEIIERSQMEIKQNIFEMHDIELIKRLEFSNNELTDLLTKIKALKK